MQCVHEKAPFRILEEAVNLYSTASCANSRGIAGRGRESGIRGAQWLPSRVSEKRCAAQAEYARLAAQAYSPSDAMSQAGICLDGIQKGSKPVSTNLAGRRNGDLRAA